MADVLLARTTGLEGFERHVVIKRIRHELAHDRRFIRMFLDEARVAATLHHQNIVQVHDVGEAGGEYFIAMEHVHGEDVRRLLKNAARQRSHVPLGYAAAIVSAAAAGLHHAHERLGSDRRPLHIVHRDVSPSNILVGYDGAVKLVDFGIATASLQREARASSLSGKLAYMSPEQCAGGAVDRRSDVYGLGVVLYELATTTPMLQTDSDRERTDRVVHGRIAPPHTRRPELPRELSDIILRALATDPGQRYATADELRIALDQFAWNAGLTSPASSLAAYLRQQFGERPEPWLELEDVAAAADDFEEISVSHVAPMPVHSEWDEPPNSTDRHPHAGAISSRLDPLGGVTGSALRSAGLPPSAPVALRPATGRSVALIGGAAGAAVAAAIWFASSVLVPRSPAGTAPALAPAPVAVAAAPAPSPSMPATATVPPPAAMAVAEPPTALPVDAGAADDAATGRTAHAPGQRTAAPPDPPARARPDRAVRVATVAPRGAETSPVRSRPERDAAPEPPAPASEPAPEPARPATAPPAASSSDATPAPRTSAPSSAPAVASAPQAHPAQAQVISPTALEANRIAGDKTILPDALTQDAITRRAASEAVVSTYKVCVSAEGEVSLVSQMRSSGFAAYDEKIRATIRTTWRYRPFVVNGTPTPVCTALRFVYSQS
jgi:serine/threonine-protein kinase